MNLQNLFNHFIGSGANAYSADNSPQGISDTLSKLGNKLPGALAGGAAAGGIMSLLIGNKSARKFAGKAATYGGAALLGGLAYKAIQNWQQNSIDQTETGTGSNSMKALDEQAFVSSDVMQPVFELTLIKAMIAAAKADGHIDNMEQKRIFKAIKQMELSDEMKGMIFDLLEQEIKVEELAEGIDKVEQKSELYLASCIAINPDHPSEQAHLDQLATALELPEGLAQQLRWQAQQAITEAA